MLRLKINLELKKIVKLPKVYNRNRKINENEGCIRKKKELLTFCRGSSGNRETQNTKP